MVGLMPIDRDPRIELQMAKHLTVVESVDFCFLGNTYILSC